MDVPLESGYKYFIRLLPVNRADVLNRVVDTMRRQGWTLHRQQTVGDQISIVFAKKDTAPWVIAYESAEGVIRQARIVGSVDEAMEEWDKLTVAGNRCFSMSHEEMLVEKYNRFERILWIGEDDIDEPIDPSFDQNNVGDDSLVFLNNYDYLEGIYDPAYLDELEDVTFSVSEGYSEQFIDMHGYSEEEEERIRQQRLRDSQDI